MDDLVEEVRRLRAVMEIAFADRIKESLEQAVKTDKQRAVWNAIDGQRSSADIAKAAGVTTRLVNLLVAELQTRGLVGRGSDGVPARYLATDL